MKTILITFILFITTSNSWCLCSKNQVKNLSTLCKVWGYMKYYHPDVCNGVYDWDVELFEILPIIIDCDHPNQLEGLIYQWVKKYEIDDSNYEVMKFDSTQFDLYLNQKWIDNLGNDTLRFQLKKMFNTKRGMSSTYVQYDQAFIPKFHEKKYDISKISDIRYRLLFLFKAWNVIEYFYPYKNILDRDWHDVLNELIPQYIQATNINNFWRNCCNPFIVALNDNHVALRFEENESPFPKRYEGFKPSTKFIENKLMVIDIDSSQSEFTGIKTGDIITKVNNKPINYYLKKYKKEYSCASSGGLKYSIYANIFCSTDSIINISYKRYYKRQNIKINIKELEDTLRYQNDALESYRFVCDSILYILPASITKAQHSKVLSYIQSSKGVIFDMRKYPKNIYYIIESMTSKTTNFVSLQIPFIPFPGYFIKKTPVPNTSKGGYDGRIVVLTDENSVSHAEFSTMKLQTADNCITIGDNTMGVDGNARSIVLPFNLRLSFTAIGIYYPDGGETQRVGVKIDEIVKPTIRGIREGRDEVLERAIEIINSQK